MKVLYFGSVEAPYQHSFWDECSKLTDVRCVYLFSQQIGHSWASYGSSHTIYLDYDQKKFVAIKKLLSTFLRKIQTIDLDCAILFLLSPKM